MGVSRFRENCSLGERALLLVVVLDPGAAVARGERDAGREVCKGAREAFSRKREESSGRTCGPGGSPDAGENVSTGCMFQPGEPSGVGDALLEHSDRPSVSDSGGSQPSSCEVNHDRAAGAGSAGQGQIPKEGRLDASFTVASPNRSKRLKVAASCKGQIFLEKSSPRDVPAGARPGHLYILDLLQQVCSL